MDFTFLLSDLKADSISGAVAAILVQEVLSTRMRANILTLVKWNIKSLGL